MLLSGASGIVAGLSDRKTPQLASVQSGLRGAAGTPSRKACARVKCRGPEETHTCCRPE